MVLYSAAIVSDFIQIFNLENCNRTDSSLFRLSSDFDFDLSHCTCLAASAAGSRSSLSAGLQDNEQCEESDSSDSDGQSAPSSLIF